MPLPKKKIALFTTTEGHYSIAEAIAVELQKNYQVKIYFEREQLFDFYAAFYKYFPAVLRVPFYVSDRKEFSNLIDQFCKNKYLGKVTAFLKKNKPSLVISTFNLFNSSIEECCKLSGTPFVNVLTDPYTTHLKLISKKADFNTTFDLQQKKACMKKKRANYVETGWFVRPQFEETYDQADVRKKLGLDPNILTFLVVSGSEGSNFVSGIFPAILSSAEKLQIVIACGGNKSLLKTVQVMAEITERIKDKITIVPLPFTTEIHKYMQAADLVIGKAGPNMLFESVATKTPFFAITHLPGQEDGNLTIIKNYNLGYVEENPFKAAKILKRIVAHPKELDQFAAPLEALAEHNRQSKKILSQAIAKLLN